MTPISATTCGTEHPAAVEGDGNGLARILGKHQQERGGLIAILEEIQLRYGYLSEESLRAVSAATGRSLVDVYGVATFYRAFSLKPRGKHLICACLGTACHVRGGPAVAEEIQRLLAIRPGETTADGQFSWETVNCLGACALGPVVVIDGQYYSKVRKRQVRGLIEDILAGRGLGRRTAPNQLVPLEANCPYCNHSLMDPRCPIDDRPSIRLSISFDHRCGWLRLSSWYGSDQRSAEHEIPAETVTRFYCPHCHEDLAGGETCAECEAPMARLLARGGATLRICTRRGCSSRNLDLS